MFKRVGILIFLIVLVYVGNAFLNPFSFKKVPEGFKPSYGFTYSFEQSRWYGLDGRAQFTWLLDNIHFSWVRLPFFWDQMTDASDNLKIDDMKFAINEAKKHNVKVVVALGIKTPYYPEYHIPQKYLDKLKFGDTIFQNHPIAQNVLDIDVKLVKELAQYDNIIYWQVENEPLLANVNNWKIDPVFLSSEVEAVRKADIKRREVILTNEGSLSLSSRWNSLLDILKPGDALGVNTFFTIQGTNLFAFSAFGRDVKVPWPNGLAWPVQSWYLLSPNYESIKSKVEAKGANLWIMEMQAEPYIRVIEDARRNDLAFGAADIKKADNFVRVLRVKNVGLWGANYWLYRRSIGDSSWIEAAREVVN